MKKNIKTYILLYLLINLTSCLSIEPGKVGGLQKSPCACNNIIKIKEFT